MNDLTRREFASTATALVTLSVLGCDSRAQTPPATQPGTPPVGTLGEDEKSEEQKKRKANLATEPFFIGAISKYRNAGLYEQYKPEKGVWVVSDGKKIVALSASCTHINCTTNWFADRGVFQCPCHESQFRLSGHQIDGSKAKRPLERCALRQVNTGSGPQIEVDPTRRFREDKGEWSDPASTMPL